MGLITILGEDNFKSQFYVKRVAIPKKLVLLTPAQDKMAIFWPYYGQIWPNMAILWPNLGKIWPYYGQIWPNMSLITIFGEHNFTS